MAIECFEARPWPSTRGYRATRNSELDLSYLLSAMNGLRSMREVDDLGSRGGAVGAGLLISRNRHRISCSRALAAAYDYDWIEAEAQFRLAPGEHVVASSDVQWAYASFYLQPLGRFQEAVAQMERAVEHDPLNVVWRGVLGSHLTHAQLYDRAIEQANEALKIDAANWVPHFTLGEAYVRMGRWPEAVECP